jgi:hypothetical protein
MLRKYENNCHGWLIKINCRIGNDSENQSSLPIVKAGENCILKVAALLSPPPPVPY